MQRNRFLPVLAGAFALGALATVPAQAAVISVTTNAALGTTPVVATVGGGLGTLSFTAATIDGVGPGAAVSTGGTAQIASIFGSIGDYQVGTVFDGSPQFAAYPTATTIQFSAADDFIGFAYTGTDGTHLGYAELFGSTLVGYAYESTPGASITATSFTAAAVPEPASIALLVGSLAAVGFVRRRGKTSALAA